MPDKVIHFAGIACIVALSSICYSSLFCLLGTIMYKRPMIIAIIYTLIVEVIISFLPVVANGLTLNFYLRSIMSELWVWNSNNQS